MAVNNQVNINLNAKDNASKSFDKLKKSSWGLSKSLWKIKGPLKAIWIWLAAAWAAVWVAGKQMFDLADSIETTIWKSQTVFWEYFDDIQKVADETAKSMGLTRTEYLKAASWMADLLKPMWFTTEQATEMTKETIWLAGALAEWSNWQYTAAEAAEIMQKAMLGETEQLKSMGISIQTWSEEFKALQASIQETTWATADQAKALAIQKLLFEKSTDAQKAFAEGADSLTRKKAELSATLWNVKETIATALIPAFHNILNTIAPVIEKVAENIEQWFKNKENVEKLTTVIKGLITAFGVIFKIIWLVVDILFKLGEALGLAAFKAMEFSITVKDAFVSMWEAIAEVWNGVKEVTVSVFDSIWEIVSWAIDTIVSKFTAAFDKIKAIVDKIKEFWGAVADTVSSAASSAASAVWLDWTAANGWNIRAWQSFLVWERGPEIFTPSQSGSITPNSGIGWWITINMGGVTVTDEADENRLVNKIKQSLTDDMQMYKNFWIS